MPSVNDIVRILEEVFEGRQKYTWERVEVGSSDYTEIGNKIYEKIAELLLELKIENAELHAKTKVYEAIIENSNFKAAVIGRMEKK